MRTRLVVVVVVVAFVVVASLVVLLLPPDTVHLVSLLEPGRSDPLSRVLFIRGLEGKHDDDNDDYFVADDQAREPRYGLSVVVRVPCDDVIAPFS